MTRNSPAVALAGRILAQREGGPRLNRNMLVFTAAAANRLGELRAAARSYLAWCSIVDDSASLDLTAHQASQARTKQSDTSQQVDALIAETFTQVLIPTQKPGTPEVEWQTARASTDGRHRRPRESQAGQQRGTDRPPRRRAGTDGHRPL